MKTFKVGDRVVGYTGEGVVVRIDKDEGMVGVKHVTPAYYMHSLGGICELGFGYWYNPNNITLLDSKPAFKGNIK